jgi:hypothetical protein
MRCLMQYLLENTAMFWMSVLVLDTLLGQPLTVVL